ncbi:unnamed protein product, partial [Bacillus phage SPG24]
TEKSRSNTGSNSSFFPISEFLVLLCAPLSISVSSLCIKSLISSMTYLTTCL